MTYAMELRTIQSRPIVGIRVTTVPAELGATMDQLLPEVWGYLEGRGVQPAGPPFARYHDYGAERVDLEAGLPVSEPVAGEGRIAAGELPAGRAAVTWHVGPYDTLREAYDALASWIAAQGHRSAGAPWEVYWTDPGEVPDPAEWKTEVFWPLAGAAD